jgi:hypothetical protein
MSTATMDPPLRAVFTPTDAAVAAEVLAQQKSRWAYFLIARDAVLDAAQGIYSRALQLVEKLGLTSAVEMARRALGWLLKGVARAGQHLRAPGVRPGVLWALTTSWGQETAGEIARTIGEAVGTTVRLTYRSLLGGLRRLGKPGQAVAHRVEAVVGKAKGGTLIRLRPVGEAAQILLSPKGPASHIVSAWARFKVLSLILVRRLPRPWNVLGLMLAAGVSVPSKVRQLGYRLVRDFTGSTKPVETEDDDPTPPAAHVRLVPSPGFSDEELTQVQCLAADEDLSEVPAQVISEVGPESVIAKESSEAAANELTLFDLAVIDVAVNDALNKSLQRQPAAKRSTNAKKRR